MRESDIEKYLRQRVNEHGGEVRGVQWKGRCFAPDNVVFLNGGHFVECKRPKNAVLARGQVNEHKKMRKRGVEVWLTYTTEEVDQFIAAITG